MPKSDKAINPFYVILVVAGVSFAITACAYGVMTVQKRDPVQMEQTGGHGLVTWMDQHGATLLMVQLVILMLATLAAIGTDEFWTRRAARRTVPDAAEDAAEKQPPSRPDNSDHSN